MPPSTVSWALSAVGSVSLKSGTRNSSSSSKSGAAVLDAVGHGAFDPATGIGFVRAQNDPAMRVLVGGFYSEVNFLDPVALRKILNEPVEAFVESDHCSAVVDGDCRVGSGPVVAVAIDDLFEFAGAGIVAAEVIADFVDLQRLQDGTARHSSR
jgi:hypothetical protein